MTNTSAITEVVAHEIGHTMDLLDCNYPGCPVGSSVMESEVSAPGTTINSVVGQPGPTPCDITAVLSVATDYACPPPPPPSGGGGCNGCGTPDQVCPNACTGSPIILDISGKGFDLTSAAGGVQFDISGRGHPIQMGWTAPGAQNAFLCLPDSNGACDDGKDLFGNFTPQPASPTPNGFAALAVYDLPANGGNGDGFIDSGDAIFPYLRLWIDANHDGISQPEELHTLPSLGVTSISLNYKMDQRTDQFGNVLHYRAQVNPGDPTSTGRVAYDVFFVTSQPTSKNIPRTLVPRTLIPTDAHKCVVPVPTKGGMLSTSGR